MEFLSKFISNQGGSGLSGTGSKTTSTGFRNFGATCYENSCMVILRGIASFRNILMRGQPTDEQYHGMRAENQQKCLTEVVDGVKAVLADETIGEVPKQIRRSLHKLFHRSYNLDGCSMDLGEYFGHIMQCFRERPGQLSFETIRQCGKCKKIHRVSEPMYFLTLNRKPDGSAEILEEILKDKVEPLEAGNRYECSKCGIVPKATQKERWTTPGIIAVDIREAVSLKVSERIDHRKEQYDLYAVARRSGLKNPELVNKKNNGHYVAAVKNADGIWYKYDDDEEVERVKFEDVVKCVETDQTIDAPKFLVYSQTVLEAASANLGIVDGDFNVGPGRASRGNNGGASSNVSNNNGGNVSGLLDEEFELDDLNNAGDEGSLDWNSDDEKSWSDFLKRIDIINGSSGILDLSSEDDEEEEDDDDIEKRKPSTNGIGKVDKSKPDAKTNKADDDNDDGGIVFGEEEKNFMARILNGGSEAAFEMAVAREIAEFRREAAAERQNAKALPSGTCHFFRCLICPNKCFLFGRSLLRHISNKHQGRKKIKSQYLRAHPVRGFYEFAKEIWNNQTLLPWEGNKFVACCPLKDTARLVRYWNREISEKEGRNRQDYQTLHSPTGARLLLRSSKEFTTAVPVTTQTIVTASFIRDIVAHAVLCYGRPENIYQKLVGGAYDTSLRMGVPERLPKVDVIRKLVVRICEGETMKSKISCLKTMADVVFNSYTDLSVDGTVKIAQSIIGNVPEGVDGERREEQERSVVTVKGRTGLLLGASLCPNENYLPSLLAALEEAIKPEFRSKVECIKTDNPTVLLSDLDAVMKIFPGLKCIGEDVVHMKIRLERCSAENGNQISILCHGAAMSIFGGEGNLPGDDKWTKDSLKKENDEALKSYERYVTKVETQTKDGKKEVKFENEMKAAKAKSILLAEEKTLISPAKWGEVLAAVACLGQHDMLRRDKSVFLGDTLRAQCMHYATMKLGALRRASKSKQERDAEAIGTNSNEALHRELRRWGTAINRQHLDLLRSKLVLFVFIKLSMGVLRIWRTHGTTQKHILNVFSRQIKHSSERWDVVVDSPEEWIEKLMLRHEASVREKKITTDRQQDKTKRLQARGVLVVIKPGSKAQRDLKTLAARNRSFAKRSGKPHAKGVKNAAIPGSKHFPKHKPVPVAGGKKVKKVVSGSKPKDMTKAQLKKYKAEQGRVRAQRFRDKLKAAKEAGKKANGMKKQDLSKPKTKTKVMKKSKK